MFTQHFAIALNYNLRFFFVWLESHSISSSIICCLINKNNLRRHLEKRTGIAVECHAVGIYDEFKSIYIKSVCVCLCICKHLGKVWCVCVCICCNIVGVTMIEWNKVLCRELLHKPDERVPRASFFFREICTFEI